MHLLRNEVIPSGSLNLTAIRKSIYNFFSKRQKHQERYFILLSYIRCGAVEYSINILSKRILLVYLLYSTYQLNKKNLTSPSIIFPHMISKQCTVIFNLHTYRQHPPKWSEFAKKKVDYEVLLCCMKTRKILSHHCSLIFEIQAFLFGNFYFLS